MCVGGGWKGWGGLSLPGFQDAGCWPEGVATGSVVVDWKKENNSDQWTE